jgi:ribose/xylose/arabinose/galactoside ABC-type transport system permease subunit
MTAISEPGARAKRYSGFAVVLQRFGALGFFGTLAVIAANSAPDYFTGPNLLMLLGSLTSSVGIIAVGVLFVTLTGGVDLSVGSIAALGSVLSAYLITFPGYSVPVAILLAVLSGAACGIINGILVAYLKWHSFFVSLAMMLLVGNLSDLTSGFRSIYLGDGGEALNVFGRSFLFGLPEPLILMLAAYLVCGFVLNHTRFGRLIAAIASNEDAVRLSGIAVPRYILAVFVISGALAAAAGVMFTSLMGGGSTYLGDGAVLEVIAAVVIGGAGLRGGRGGVVTTLLGVLVVGCIFHFLLIVDVTPNMQRVCMVVIIAIALLIQYGARSLRR